MSGAVNTAARTIATGTPYTSSGWARRAARVPGTVHDMADPVMKPAGGTAGQVRMIHLRRKDTCDLRMPDWCRIGRWGR
ncbi:hypothetical protein GCM10023080_040380 [Streptomyces pseudoechinosporeus]